jgi:hypothetical protein
MTPLSITVQEKLTKLKETWLWFILKDVTKDSDEHPETDTGQSMEESVQSFYALSMHTAFQDLSNLEALRIQSFWVCMEASLHRHGW